MSYIVIPVYSFSCDGQLNGRDCPHEFECTPANQAGRSLLNEALRQLRAEKWRVTGRGADRRHFCPRH